MRFALFKENYLTFYANFKFRNLQIWQLAEETSHNLVPSALSRRESSRKRELWNEFVSCRLQMTSRENSTLTMCKWHLETYLQTCELVNFSETAKFRHAEGIIKLPNVKEFLSLADSNFDLQGAAKASPECIVELNLQLSSFSSP